MKKTTLHTAAMALLMMGGASCATKTSVLGVTKEPIVTKEPTDKPKPVVIERERNLQEEEKIERKLDVKDMIEKQRELYDYLHDTFEQTYRRSHMNCRDATVGGIYASSDLISFGANLQNGFRHRATEDAALLQTIPRRFQLELIKVMLVKKRDLTEDLRPSYKKAWTELCWDVIKDKGNGFRKDVKSDVGRILKGSWLSFSNWSPSKNPVGAIQKLIDKCD